MSALDYAIDVLGCFTLTESELSQAELARRIGCPKATMSRILKVMRERSLLNYSPTTRQYSPGPKLYELGQIFRARRNFFDSVQRHLKRVCETGGHSGYITTFDGADLVVIQMIRGSNSMAIASTPGFRVPAHSNSNGRAMLALLPDKEWRRRLPEPLAHVSPKTPANHKALQKAIDDIRKTGRSHSSNELHDGVSSQGIAFRDPDTFEIVGVAVSYPTTLLTEQLRQDIDALLSTMLSDIQHETGAALR